MSGLGLRAWGLGLVFRLGVCMLRGEFLGRSIIYARLAVCAGFTL